MRPLIPRRERVRNRVFPIRITGREDQQLREQAKTQGKSMGELVREGYLAKINRRTYLGQ